MTTAEKSYERRPATIADIDVKLVAARWLHLHAVWSGDRDEADRTAATLDELLEERHRISVHEREVREPA